MAQTRRELIAAGGQVAGALAVASIFGPIDAAVGAASSDPAVVLAARWSGLSRTEFLDAWHVLSEMQLNDSRVGALGAVVTWSPDAREGQVLAEWASAAQARRYLDSGTSASALKDRGARLPDETRVIEVTVS